MSTTAVDLDSPGRAVHQGQFALDLAAYVLTPLRKDTEFVLLRGVRPAPLDGNGPSSILALMPVANSPSATTLRALQNDYALRSELDPQYAVRSLAIVRRIIDNAGRHLAVHAGLLCEVGRDRVSLETTYPETSFLWLDTEESSGEVFWLGADALR